MSCNAQGRGALALTLAFGFWWSRPPALDLKATQEPCEPSPLSWMEPGLQATCTPGGRWPEGGSTTINQHLDQIPGRVPDSWQGAKKCSCHAGVTPVSVKMGVGSIAAAGSCLGLLRSLVPPPGEADDHPWTLLTHSGAVSFWNPKPLRLQIRGILSPILPLFRVPV